LPKREVPIGESAVIDQDAASSHDSSKPGRGTVAKVRELPELVGEFVTLAKQYVRQRTIVPAKALGRLAGLGMAAAALFALAAIFLAVAGMRLIIQALPTGTVWSGFGYLIAAVGLFIVTGIVVWRATR
jgi:hypothetical protein